MGVRIVNNVSAQLEALGSALKPERVAKVIGVKARELVKEHFYKLNSERHRSSATTGFYAEAAKQTQMQVSGTLIQVAVNKIGIRQRYYGGPIIAGAGGTGRKYLTIPARSETYGRSALEFSNLAVLYGKQVDGGVGPIALVEAPQSLVVTDPYKKGKIRKSEKRTSQYNRPTIGGAVMFWLRKRVDQIADESVIPTVDDFMKMIQTTVDNLVQVARKKETPPEET